MGVLISPSISFFANLHKTMIGWMWLVHAHRLFQCKCHRWSGVRATVDGQIRTGDVRRFRTSHERYQSGDFVNRSVAVEGCIGLLGRGPIAAAGFKSVSIGPGWILLTVMPRVPTSLDNP